MNILETLKDLGGLLEGHFVLKSGRHSKQYLNKDVIYPHTWHMMDIGRALAAVFTTRRKIPHDVDLVIGPAMGGIILSQWTAKALNEIEDLTVPVLSLYAEKEQYGSFVFNRGYAEMIPGKKVLLVEDIITTGGSIVAVAEEVIRLGGTVVGIVALVNRGNVQIENLYALASLNIESWDAADCPLCKQNIPINTNVGHGGKK